MRKVDPSYIGHINNIVDLFRIIRVLLKPKNIVKSEKKYLALSLIPIFIIYITAVFLLCVFLFFSDIVW